MPSRSLPFALVLLAAAAPASARAQIRASEIGTVSQVVDGTTIAVEYSRPRMRGRSPIFGTKIVHWGEVWTPGANYATTLRTSKDVSINGTKVQKGKYAVWMVVRERGDWTLLLDTTVRRFHEDRPDTMKVAYRIPAKQEQASPALDVLTWSFPAVRANGATLALQWDTYRVPLDITVEASLRIPTPQAEAAAYLGTYEGAGTGLSFMPKDPFTLAVSYENGVLRGEFSPEDRYLRRFALIRVAPDVFAVGIYDTNGVIYEVLRPDMMITFKRNAGRVTSFEIRDGDDKLDAVATRRRDGSGAPARPF